MGSTSTLSHTRAQTSTREPPTTSSKITTDVSEENRRESNLNLVRKSYQVRYAFSLTVHDLFAFFGDWSDFYIRTMCINGLVWATTEIHEVLMQFLSVSTGEINFQGVNRTCYEPIPQLRTFSLTDIGTVTGRELPTDDPLFYTSREKFTPLRNNLNFVGICIGSVVTIAARRRSQQVTVLVAGIVYLLACLIAFGARYLPIVKTVLVIIAMCNEICVLSILLHCVQNLPAHLRPLALCLLNTVDSLAGIAIVTAFRMVSQWYMVGLAVPLLLALSTLIYYAWAPDNLILALLAQKGQVLEAAVTKYNQGKVVIDSDLLIDDVVYTKTATVSPWKRVFKLFTVKNFIIKYIILIGLMSIYEVRASSVFLDIEKLATFGFMESYLMRYVAIFSGGFLSALLVYALGRREALILSLLLETVAFCLLLIVPIEVFNICQLASSTTGEWRLISSICIFLSTAGLRSLSTTTVLVLVEHVPVEQHSICVPLANLAANVLCAIVTHLIKSAEGALDQAIHSSQLLCFILLLLIGLSVPFLDNSGVMPLTSDDFRCYYFKNRKYTTHPVWADLTEELTSEPSSDSSVE